MTIDEKLILPDSAVGRLKIEYEILFSNPIKARRPAFGGGREFGVCWIQVRNAKKSIPRNVLVDSKKKAEEAVSGNFNSFPRVVSKKPEQIPKESGCHRVEYRVKTRNGQVRPKAEAQA